MPSTGCDSPLRRRTASPDHPRASSGERARKVGPSCDATSVEDALKTALSELRPIRTWASATAVGVPEPWQRTEDTWDLPAPPEDYALPPALPWTERLRDLALRAYNERFGKYLDPGQRYEMDWPPEGSLSDPGSWYVETPSCPMHGEDLDDGCRECDAAAAEPSTVIDRPASWEWNVGTRLVITETLPDGSSQEHEEDEDRWLLGFTDVDPREVEYGPEKGTGERADLVRAFWKAERDKLAAFRYFRKSDVDGDRHLIVETPGLDCNGWRLEVRSNNRTYVSDFTRTQVYGVGEATNFLGYGESRTAWVAYMDWGSEEGHLLLPDGSRHELSAAMHAGAQRQETTPPVRIMLTQRPIRGPPPTSGTRPTRGTPPTSGTRPTEGRVRPGRRARRRAPHGAGPPGAGEHVATYWPAGGQHRDGIWRFARAGPWTGSRRTAA